MSQIQLYGGKRRAARVQTRPRREKKGRSARKTWTVILLVLALLECLYFTCVYSQNPFIAKWRGIYIQTAMSTMRHQWLATSLIPQHVIDGVMKNLSDAQAAQVGVHSQWNQNNQSGQAPDTVEPVEEDKDPEEESFYRLFWELDRDSMESYLQQHPEALDGGWDNLYINEAGLDDSGTSIRTTMGEQVLAIDVPNEILLLRVKGSNYQGVLAVAKDPSRLSVQTSSMLGGCGQVAGTIAENHNGVLAMSANGFIDVDGEGNQGRGNGGIISGYTMSDGESYGRHMGWSNKRVELHEDNYLYITDAQAEVHPDTTDAAEFGPALIVDGEILVDENSGWNGIHPRAAIGQSDRGEILMLVIEGRLVGISLGTGVAECAGILKSHNAMQAMNMDGGTSAILWYHGEYVTRCSNTACPEGRMLPNAFVYANHS